MDSAILSTQCVVEAECLPVVAPILTHQHNHAKLCAHKGNIAVVQAKLQKHTGHGCRICFAIWTPHSGRASGGAMVSGLIVGAAFAGIYNWASGAARCKAVCGLFSLSFVWLAGHGWAAGLLLQSGCLDD